VRIVSYRRDDGAERFGIVDGDVVRDAGTDLTDLETADTMGRLDEMTVLAPVPRPDPQALPIRCEVNGEVRPGRHDRARASASPS
jgi:hypothetical protein